MTNREIQKRLVDLSIVAISALVLGGTYVLAARVDLERQPIAMPEPLSPPQPTSVAQAPPVAGLIPAPIPSRRVVVVRRSRAS